MDTIHETKFEELKRYLKEMEAGGFFDVVNRKPSLLSNAIRVAIESSIPEYARYAKPVYDALKKEINTQYNYRICVGLAKILLCRDAFVRNMFVSCKTFPGTLLTSKTILDIAGAKARQDDLSGGASLVAGARQLLQYAYFKNPFESFTFHESSFISESGEPVFYSSDILYLHHVCEALSPSDNCLDFEEYIKIYGEAVKVDRYFELPLFAFNAYENSISLKAIDKEVVEEARRVTDIQGCRF